MDKDKLLEKIMSRILVTNKGCWEWQGAKCGPGYGKVCIEYDPKTRTTKTGMTHRVIYELMKKPIPEGYVLSHICNNRLCCNPAHLEPMLQKENLAYMDALDRRSNGINHGLAISMGFKNRNTQKPPSKRRIKRIYAHEELLTTLNEYTIKTDTGCWIWTKNGSQKRYGKIHGGYEPDTGKEITLAVHRISYEIHKGPIPDGMQVCHTCDNRLCWNPDHLWLGTIQENTYDRNRKNRQSRGPAHAELRRIAAERNRIKAARAAGATPDHKYCPQCDQWLTRDKFSKNATTYDGLYGFCKECRSKYRKREDREKAAIREAEALRKLKEDAAKAGVPMDDFEDWKRCARCHKWLLKTMFSKSSYQKTGLMCHCKDCAALEWQKYAKKHAKRAV